MTIKELADRRGDLVALCLEQKVAVCTPSITIPLLVLSEAISQSAAPPVCAASLVWVGLISGAV